MRDLNQKILLENSTAGHEFARLSGPGLIDRGKMWSIAALPRVNAGLPPETERFFPDKAKFIELSTRTYLPGSRSETPVLAISGLGVTGQGTWLPICQHLNDRFGTIASIQSLPGHDGTWEGLLRNGGREWVQFIIDKRNEVVEFTGRVPFALMHSTAASAAIVASRSFSEVNSGKPLFAGIVAVAPPLDYRSAVYRWALDSSIQRYEEYPAYRAWRKLAVRMSSEESGVEAYARWLPLKCILELHKLGLKAVDSMRFMETPLLVTTGQKDVWISASGVERIVKACGPLDTSFAGHTGWDHHPTCGEHRDVFSNIVIDWMRRAKAFGKR